jgi:hypothetical protein
MIYFSRSGIKTPSKAQYLRCPASRDPDAHINLLSKTCNPAFKRET